MRIIRKFKTEKKEIALTFDDGPDERNTPEIIRILAKYKVNTTFFVCGKNVEKFPDLTIKIQKNGHELGNHTFSHSSLRFRTVSFIREEIRKNDDLLLSLGIGKTKIFRPPYGRFFPFVPFVLRRMNKEIILWNVGAKDYKAEKPEQIVEYILQRTTPGSIIVLHDGGGNRKITIQALERFIPKLLKNGFVFKKISEMMK